MASQASPVLLSGGRNGVIERAQAAGRRLGMLTPAIVLMLIFFLGPILWCVYASFTDISLSGAGASNTQFVGIRNFTQLFADGSFRQSLVLTVIFVLGSAVIGQNLLGLLLALLMKDRSRAVRGVVGTLVIGAWVVPEIVAAFIWYAFLGQQGTLNNILGAIGLGGQNWLYSTPMLAVILANIWRGTAFSMLVYSAALSDVPPDLLEAAAVDGASPLRQLRHITLPLIKRAVMTNLMLITLQTLAVFTLVFALTGGGPGSKSQTLPIYMYQQAFKFYQLGYGTAAALLLLAVGAVFSLVYVRALKVED